MRRAWKKLRPWFAKIRYAQWLHPEFDAGKRATVFGFAVFVSASLVSQIPTMDFSDSIPVARPLYEQFTAVTRRAFVPRLFVQMYEADPMLRNLLEA